MKSVKYALVIALLVIVVFAGCKSSAKPAPGIKLESTAKVETIEHKGTAFGIKEIPQWLSEFIQRNGTRAVENLSEFSGKYVIIGQASASGKQQAETWAKNFDAQQQIGATIRTRVASVFKAHENLLPNEEESKRKYDNAINTLVQATYTGAQQISDWWIHQRVTPERGAKPEERFDSYVLYTIDKKFLDQQISNEVIKIKNNDDAEMAAAFDAIAIQLLEIGLNWEDE